MKSLTFTKTLKNVEKIVAVSSTMDCMITVAQMAVNVYDINSSNPNTLSSPRNVLDMVRDSIKTLIVIESTTRASKNVAVMPGCRVFKFIDTYYVQDGTGSYKKSTLSTLPSTTVFDPSMKFYMIQALKSKSWCYWPSEKQKWLKNLDLSKKWFLRINK